MKNTLIRLLAVLLAGAASGATKDTGATTIPAGAPAAPGAVNQGTIASPPITGAATPMNPNAPPPGAAANPNPAQTQPPVSGAATPLNPNAPVPGAPAGPPSNATLGAQPQTTPPPVAGQVPTTTIAAAIQNPAATNQTGVSSPGQSAPTVVTAPGAAPILNIQNFSVVRQNGALVLTGAVHTQADKDAAALRASAASGGEPVVNDIVIQ